MIDGADIRKAMADIASQRQDTLEAFIKVWLEKTSIPVAQCELVETRQTANNTVTTSFHLRRLEEFEEQPEVATPNWLVKYEVVQSGATFCPHCHRAVRLLCPAGRPELEAGPSFGVCFECRFIVQLLVGAIYHDNLKIYDLPNPEKSCFPTQDNADGQKPE